MKKNKGLIVILGNQKEQKFYDEICWSYNKKGWETHILKLDSSNSFFAELLELNPSAVIFTPSDFSINQDIYSEFGFIQGFLDLNRIKYSGSGPTSSLWASNKHLAKIIFNSLGIKTPKYIYVSENKKAPKYGIVEKKLGKKIIIKPNRLGDSVGVKIVRNQEEYYSCINSFKEKYNSDFLLEELIDNDNTEYTTGVFEGKNYSIQLPICKTTTFTEFFSYECKVEGLNEKEIISDITVEDYKKMQSIASTLHKAFKCKNFSRTDFLIDREHNIYVLEINLLPGLLSNSIFPQLCLEVGISRDEILDSLI